MKASLTFDLNEHDDTMAHMRCVKSLDMAIAIWKIQQLNFELGSVEYDTIFDRINAILDEHYISINNLIE